MVSLKYETVTHDGKSYTLEDTCGCLGGIMVEETIREQRSLQYPYNYHSSRVIGLRFYCKDCDATLHHELNQS